MGRFLRINLLGSYQATLDGGEPLSYATSKVQALLAYLVMEPRVHERSRLAGLLWPDVSERAARNNLRQTLFRLRRTLDDADESAEFLQVSRQTVVWAPAGPVELDVERFLDGLQGCARHQGRVQGDCSACMTLHTDAAQLYQGDFLADLYIDDSDLLAEWVEMQRSWLRRQALRCLDHLSNWHGRQAGYDQAIYFARRQTELDPFDETGQQQLIRWLAYDGQLGAALAQARTFMAALREELGSEPTAETVTLFQQLGAGTLQPGPAAVRPAALPAPKPTRPLLPAVPLLGRDAELDHLTAWLEVSSGQPLVLHGPPGLGKTALARALLWHVAQTTERPVGQLEAGPLDELLAGSTAVLEALEPGALLLIDHVDSRHETDLQRLVHLLARRQVQAMLTCRRRLDLPAVCNWPVDPLAVGETAADSAAGALFWHYAAQHRVSRPVAAAELEQVRQLCLLLEGNPLAIKLAAQWHRLLPIPELYLEVAADPFLLGASSVAAGPLQALFAGQWAGLAVALQAKVRRLALFPGPISRQAAQAVADVALPELDCLTVAGILCRSTAGAYRLNQLWRAFLQRLPAAAEADDDGQARFVACHVTWLESLLPGLHTGEQQSALGRLELAQANLERAWQWAVQRQDQPALSRLVEGLGYYYDMAGVLETGRAVLREALARLPHLMPGLEAQLLEWQGWLCYQLGELATAYQLLERARRVAPAGGAYAPRVCVRLAIVALALGDEELAAVVARQSLAQAEALGDWQTAATALTVTGNIYLRQGDSVRAEMLLQKSLALSRMVGDRWGMSFVLSSLARFWQAKDGFDVAARFLEDSFNLRSSLGDHRRAARVLNRLGRLRRQQGALARAEAAFARAIEYCRCHELTVERTTAMMGLAEVARAGGNYPTALTQLQAALHLAVSGRRQPQTVEILFTFGHLLAEIEAHPESVPLNHWEITPGADLLAQYFLTQAQAKAQPMSREQINQIVALFFTQNPYELSQI